LDGITDWLITDEESGILVPRRNTEALESALGRMMSQPDRARAMGARARQRIECDFDIKQIAEKYLTAYRELLAS
jgi:glycosyltransferase involved in cell wall biosynthesis